MNELSTLTNSVATAERSELSKALLKVCSAITPQFYKNKTSEELQLEKRSIEILTENIEPQVLSTMCQMAIRQYPLERSRNPHTFFDINYILTFYEVAFNFFWCDSVEMGKGCRQIGYDYDGYTKILTERWERNGAEITIKYLVPQKTIDAAERHGYLTRHHSPKYYESLITDINDLNPEDM